MSSLKTKNNILSLFSGGGLLDLGFLNQGFRISEAVEIHTPFISAYNYALKNYIETSENEFVKLSKFHPIEKSKDISSKEVQLELYNNHKGITGIIGGPPCQDFSIGGKNLGTNGKRGKLIFSYYKIVDLIKPNFIFFENVEGLYKTKAHNKALDDLLERLDTSGYEVWYTTHNALEYGIPQDRSRLVLVGFKKEIVKQLLKTGYQLEKDSELLKHNDGHNYIFRWPKVIYENPKKETWPKTNGFKNTISVKDSFHIADKFPDLIVKAAFKGLNNSVPNQSDYFNPYSDKFNIIDEGDVNRKSFKRLHRYRFSPTVAYGNNEVHLHPTKARRLSVREALRLQSVPDNYILQDDLPLTDKFKLIGNGVPTKLAELLACEIRGTLDKYYSSID